MTMNIHLMKKIKVYSFSEEDQGGVSRNNMYDKNII